MSKATFEFNLPDEQTDFEIHCNANKYYCALWDVNELIFKMYKHENPPATGEECWQEVMRKLCEILQDIEFDK